MASTALPVLKPVPPCLAVISSSMGQAQNLGNATTNLPQMKLARRDGRLTTSTFTSWFGGLTLAQLGCGVIESVARLTASSANSLDASTCAPQLALARLDATSSFLARAR